MPNLYSSFQVAKQAAIALAAATGKPTTLTRRENGQWAVLTKVAKPFTPREYQGSTAEDRRSNDGDTDFQANAWGTVDNADDDYVDRIGADRTPRSEQRETVREARKLFVQDRTEALAIARRRSGSVTNAKGGGYWVAVKDRVYAAE